VHDTAAGFVPLSFTGVNDVERLWHESAAPPQVIGGSDHGPIARAQVLK
jgi:hypothetical protein